MKKRKEKRKKTNWTQTIAGDCDGSESAAAAAGAAYMSE